MGNQFVRAAKNGGLAQVRKQIELGHDVNSKSILGNGAIHCAAQYGQLDVVQALLENGADLNSMGQIGTVFCYAIYYNRMEIAELLLKSGVDINDIVNSEGMTALHVAITDRLYKDGKGGKSRLMTGKQKYPMVEFLLRYGADVNATCKDNMYQFTPLMLAAYVDHVEIADLLIKNGANVFMVSGFGSLDARARAKAAQTSGEGGNASREATQEILRRHGLSALDLARIGPTKDLLKKAAEPPAVPEATDHDRNTVRKDALGTLYEEYVHVTDEYYASLKCFQKEQERIRVKRMSRRIERRSQMSQLSQVSQLSQMSQASKEEKKTGTEYTTPSKPSSSSGRQYVPSSHLMSRLRTLKANLAIRQEEMIQRMNGIGASTCKTCEAEIEILISPS